MHKTSSVELRKIVRLVRSVILYQPRTGTSSCQFRNGTTVWTRSTRQFTMQHLLFKVNTAHASLVAFLKKHLGRKQQVKSWRINHNGFSPDSYPGADGIRTVRNLHDPVEGSYQLRDASSLTNNDTVHRTFRNMSPSTWAFDASVLTILVASFAAVMTLGVDLLFAAGYVGALYWFLRGFALTSVVAGVFGSNGFAVSSLLGQAPEDKKAFVKVSRNAFDTFHSLKPVKWNPSKGSIRLTIWHSYDSGVKSGVSFLNGRLECTLWSRTLLKPS